jgi:hypothetical protein
MMGAVPSPPSWSSPVEGEGIVPGLLRRDFWLRPFRQIDFKGGQYLTDEQIVPDQPR